LAMTLRALSRRAGRSQSLALFRGVGIVVASPE
jgi:hypothetical protein